MDDEPLPQRREEEPLRAVIFARSSAANQNKESVKAAIRDAERYLREHYHGPLEMRYVSEHSDGLPSSPALQKAEGLLASGQYDMILVEDLTRICRQAVMTQEFMQKCIEQGVRLISISNDFDTGTDPKEAH